MQKIEMFAPFWFFGMRFSGEIRCPADWRALLKVYAHSGSNPLTFIRTIATGNKEEDVPSFRFSSNGSGVTLEDWAKEKGMLGVLTNCIG